MMSQIFNKPNRFHTDATRLDHIELGKHLSRCLDPLCGLHETGENALTMPSASETTSDRPAAILVPLLWVQRTWHIVMTKRAAHLTHHAGQISFPGGKVEPCDASPVDAALREAFEEIRLIPSLIQVVGLLDKVRSPAGFLVQPVVGIVRGDTALDRLVPDPAEVDLIFTLPLMHLANPNNFRLVSQDTSGRQQDYWVVDHDEHLIWGMSARILNDLHRRVYKSI